MYIKKPKTNDFDKSIILNLVEIKNVFTIL